MKPGKIATGILIGAAVGTIAGFLLRKRSKNRKKISTKGLKLRDDMVHKFDQAMNKKERFMENGREKIASLKEEAKHALS